MSFHRYKENQNVTLHKSANGWTVESKDNLYKHRVHVFRSFEDAVSFIQEHFTGTNVHGRKSVEA